MRSLHVLILFLAALPAANAGGVDSGGGMAIVCRDQGGKIESAEVLDLWEGRMGIYAGGPRIPLASQKDFRAQIRDLNNRIRSDHYGFYLEQYVDQLMKSVTFLAAGQRLELTEDALPVLSPPAGCHFEQAAIYSVRLQRFFFSSDIWNALNETNRAALVAHEAIYLNLRREAEEKDSLYTRQVISHLFANEEIEGPHDGLPGTVYSCSTHEPGSSRSETQFYLFQESSGALKLQPTQVKNVRMFARDLHELGLYPGKTLSLEDLAEGLSHDGNESVWTFLIGSNSPATTGWMLELRRVKISNFRFVLQAAYRKPGESSAGSVVPVSCAKK